MSKFLSKTLSTVATIGILAFVAAPVLADPPPWAQNNTSNGQFDINGSIGAFCVIEVNDLGAVLDLQDGESGASVATITESCNSGTGYSISFSSVSNGMVHSEDASRVVTYQLNYDGLSMTDLNAGLSLIRTGEIFNQQRSVTIDVAGDDERIAGIYSDLIQVEIAAL